MNSNPKKEDKLSEHNQTMIGAGVAIGIGVGVAIGSAMGNIGAGIAIGISIDLLQKFIFGVPGYRWKQSS